jgi:ATP-dependent helicase/nuclease subunit A
VGHTCDQAAPAWISPTLHQVASANTFLDWLVPSLASAPTGVVRWPGEESHAKHTVSIHIHEPDEMAGWTLGAPGGVFRGPETGDDRQELTEAVTTFAPLPDDEPRTPGDPDVEEVVSRLEYTYPTLGSASVRAVVGASEFKGTYDFTSDPDAREPFAIGLEPFEIPPSRYTEEEPMTPARRGTITHRVLQHLDFAAAVAPSGVASELLRLVDEGNLTEAESAAVDRDALVWFAGTDLGRAIRQAGDRYRREFSYIANEQPTLFDASVGPLGDEAVLVRGIVDGILPVEGGLDIIDFKTDVVGPEELAARVEHYTPQMRLYARAVQGIFQKPVTACRLIFLAARQIVSVDVDAG